MYTTKKGKIMVMVQDSKKPEKYGFKWVFIPAVKWEKMTEKEKARYIV